jgi:hypothetical protein
VQADFTWWNPFSYVNQAIRLTSNIVMLPFKPFTFSNRLKRKLKDQLQFLETTFSKSDINIVA